MKKDAERLVELAMEGDGNAIEQLIKSVQDRIYGLAVKMLYSIPDAEDAAQEILIKIVTRLGSFRKESAFHTWAMKIAANHLLNKRKSKYSKAFTFKSCEEMIIRDMPDPPTLDYARPEQDLIVRELQIVCVQGLFQCLDREHRIVYILGQTMDVTGPEGSQILGITPAGFRKRLSRAREKIRAFLVKNCELFDEGNPCKCVVQTASAVNKNLIHPNDLQHLSHTRGRACSADPVVQLRQIEKLSRQAALMRIHPDYTAPGAFVGRIREMLSSGAISC